MASQENKWNDLEREAIIGRSPAMITVRRMAKRMAKRDDNVLIFGEVGVGKAFLAQQIHKLSPRAAKPFVTINCNALGENITEADLFGEKVEENLTVERKIGLLEQADEGTLFLNNLGELHPDYQLKFLTLVQQGAFRSKGGDENLQVKFRIISAAKPDIESKIESNQFRKDLYFLLNAVTIEVPPLRERRQDIPYLFEYFLKKFCKEMDRELPTVPSDVFESLMQYDWPGNVRELQSCVRNLLVMSPAESLSMEYLPMQIRRHPLEFLSDRNLSQALADVEKYLIEKALKKFHGNQSKAAKFLAVSESTLRYKMGKYHMQRKRSRAAT